MPRKDKLLIDHRADYWGKGTCLKQTNNKLQQFLLENVSVNKFKITTFPLQKQVTSAE